ncbi:thioredoxin family protein [Sulfuriflexus mobilis]|uniref:thioredoxin family protein n=1 Tax=Sulfuriflexus mobilis TaxID=1811807 RepID=UPI000F84251C|nr:thioredoxin fold domain-containing protein [Sulfuriflexus mobilis]
MLLRNVFAGVLAMLFSVAVQAEEAPRDPYVHFFNQSLGDFSEELQVAREEGKKAVMLFFEQDECPFCHYMKNTVLNQPEVQDYFRKNFALFAIDIEGDVEMTDFEGQTMKMKDFAFKLNRVRATPVIAFYDMEGKRVVRHIGKTSGKDEFMLLGRFVAEETYKEMRFTKYKREQRKK